MSVAVVKHAVVVPVSTCKKRTSTVELVAQAARKERHAKVEPASVAPVLPIAQAPVLTRTPVPNTVVRAAQLATVEKPVKKELANRLGPEVVVGCQQTLPKGA